VLQTTRFIGGGSGSAITAAVWIIETFIANSPRDSQTSELA
jgi:hypothetical protein